MKEHFFYQYDIFVHLLEEHNPENPFAVYNHVISNKFKNFIALLRNDCGTRLLIEEDISAYFGGITIL